jgi:hypothetical protein
MNQHSPPPIEIIVKRNDSSQIQRCFFKGPLNQKSSDSYLMEFDRRVLLTLNLRISQIYVRFGLAWGSLETDIPCTSKYRCVGLQLETHRRISSICCCPTTTVGKQHVATIFNDYNPPLWFVPHGNWIMACSPQLTQLPQHLSWGSYVIYQYAVLSWLDPQRRYSSPNHSSQFVISLSGSFLYYCSSAAPDWRRGIA